MYRVPLNPKHRKKYGGNKNPIPIAVPRNWSEFAPMLNIRSGKGFKKFEPFDFQIELDRLIQAHSFCAVAKCRQTGMSEYAVSKVLHESLLNPGMNSLIVSRTGLDSGKLARRMRTMIDGLGIKLLTDNLNDVVFPNGARIFFSAPGDSSGRGENSVSFVVIDEFSYLREPELTLSSALPSTSMVEDADLKILLIFTPNGKSNFAYQLLDSKNPSGFDLTGTIKKVRFGELPGLYSWRDEDNWVKLLLHWRKHPVYSRDTENYLKNVAKKQKISWKRVLREYDLSFDSSELQFIDDELIDSCAIGEYELPQRGARYYAGLDSSSIGKDYFAFAILKEEDDRLSLVHLYRQRRKSMKRHLTRIAALCDDYQIEACMVETNSIGQLYHESLSEEKPSIRWERFNATQKSNTSLFERLLMRMETSGLIYPDDPIVLQELRGLEECPESGRIEAGTVGTGETEEDQLHDDIPRAIALACQCFVQRPRRSEIDLRRQLNFVERHDSNSRDRCEL